MLTQAAGSFHCTPTSVRAKSSAANEFCIAPTPSRKRKICSGNSRPQRAQTPERHVGEAGEPVVSHPVTMEVAVSFLGTGNVTYFLVTRMLLQHLDGKHR